MLFQSSSVRSSNLPAPKPGSGMPALANITSMRPNESTAARTRRSMSASDRTSASMPTACPPAASTSLATVWARPVTMSLVTTSAPSSANSRAHSLPSPDPDPVMAMTLSFSRMCPPELRRTPYQQLIVLIKTKRR